MHIWDTARFESSRAMLPLYYPDTSAKYITHDTGNERSFDNAGYWPNKLF